MSHLPPLFLRKMTFVRPHPNPKSLAGPPRSVMLRTSPWPGWVKGRLGLARTHKGPAAPLDRKSASHALDNDPWGGETTCLCFQLGRRLLHSQLWTLKTRLMFLATQSTGSQLHSRGQMYSTIIVSSSFLSPSHPSSSPFLPLAVHLRHIQYLQSVFKSLALSHR